MPAKSASQQRLFGMCAHSGHPPKACPDMAKKKMLEFARTKTKGLPEHVGLSAALSKKERD